MEKVVRQIVDLCDKESIKYLLLRPVSLKEGFNDVDLAMTHDAFGNLVKLLMDNGFKTKLYKTNSNVSIKVKVAEVVLDIQFNITYLPYKSLIIKETFPTGKVEFTKDFVLPGILREEMFSIWIYRLFLDKPISNSKKSAKRFVDFFEEDWRELLGSAFFQRWTMLLFGEINLKQVSALIEKTMLAKFENLQESDRRGLINLLKENTPGLGRKIFLDKLKFKILRRMGLYNSPLTQKKVETLIHGTI